MTPRGIPDAPTYGRTNHGSIGAGANAPWLLLEVTRRCDRACVYCYASGRDPSDDLSPQGVEALLNRLDTQACQDPRSAVVPQGITLIGGEPLLVPELEEIVRCIRRRGIVVALSTNGLALNPERVTSLVRAGCTSLEVAFDSMNPAVRAILTGGARAPEHLALARVARMGACLTLGAMLTRHNLEQLEDLLRLAFALGARRVSLNQVALIGAARNHSALVPTDAELMRALERANTCAGSLGLQVGVGLPLEPCRLSHARYPNLEFEACHCAGGKWLIGPDGSVSTCELAPHPIGNLFESTWDELTESEGACAFRNQVRGARCLDCADWEACRGGCRFRG